MASCFQVMGGSRHLPCSSEAFPDPYGGGELREEEFGEARRGAQLNRGCCHMAIPLQGGSVDGASISRHLDHVQEDVYVG